MKRQKEKLKPKEIYMQRIKCDCMAQKHQLINNCLNCGKIVCAQEGQGNCLYCGKLVTRPDGLFIDNSQDLFPSLSKQQRQKISIEQSKAIQHKNILVERDKSEFQNQNIYDDQTDYYQISQNKWLDQGDRQKAVDRILQAGLYVEQESLKTNVKYDPLTGEFVRQEFSFDEEAFKKEGKMFLQQRQKAEKMAKRSKVNQKKNWDQRLLRSQKMRQLCSELIQSQAKQMPQISQKRTENKIVQIIIQQQ